MKKITLLVFVILACFAGFNIISKNTVSTENYTVGVLLPITGDASVYGESARNAALLHMENLAENAHSNSLNIQIEDTGLKPAQALFALEKIKNDAQMTSKKIGAIISFSSGETLALCSKTESEHILLLSSGSSPKIADCGTMTFSNFPSDIYQAKALAEKLKNTTHLGIMYMKNDYGTGLYSEFTKYNKTASVTIGFLPDTKDFRTIIAELKNKGITELLLIGQPKESSIFLKQAEELAFNPQNIYTPEALKDQSFANVVPAKYRAIIHSLAPVSYSGKEADEFRQKYVAQYAANPAIFADYVYDNITLAKKVLKECPSIDQECISKTFRNLDMTGATGPLNFENTHSAQGKEYQFFTIRNGKFEIE